MLKSILNRACLNYGIRSLPITPNETVPLPDEFDFDQPEECARRVFAIMSNASGGFPLTRCQLRVDFERRTANMTANGAHVYYQPDALPKMCIAESIAALERTKLYELGNVATDGNGEGHKHARWSTGAHHV